MNRHHLSFAFPYLLGLAVLLLMAHGWLRGRSVQVVHPLEAPEGAPACCPGEVQPGEAQPAAGAVHVDPVCRMVVGTEIGASVGGTMRYFCAARCRDLFARAPAKYLAEACLVCRAEDVLQAPVAELSLEWQGRTYAFCTAAHRAAFRSDPGGYFLHSMWGIPGWLYYVSIGFVLLLSFFFFERKEGALARRGLRLDLLRVPGLRRLVARPETRFVFQAASASLFVLIIAAGLFGNQLPAKNVAPVLTWTVWWGGLVLIILYLGKAFCYLCPWDAIAGWTESLRLWGPRRQGLGLGLGLKAKGALKTIWPATFLFVLLTWIELGLGVTLKPRATAYLALAILALAVASALVFERRFFCRYVCLVGRISGLYALFSPIEVRARDPGVCRTCTTHSCYKGSDAGNGCPTWQFPGTMPQNTYCTMCLECLRTCEPGNMTVNLRPWGEDLKAARRPRLDEAFLCVILLALTGFHGLTMTGAWRDLAAAIDLATGWGRSASFSLGMAALLAGPLAIYSALVWASRRLSGARGPFQEHFIRYAYALLPIAFFYHLAHNAEHLLMEGQKVIALISDPFGREWNLFGTAALEVPPLVSLTTLWGIQVLLVLVGHVYGVWATSRAAVEVQPDGRSRLLAHAPLLVAMILFSVFSLWLLKQPMEMRTSAM
jgi:polyferredoxin/YHS domain-containing protein